jgi:hypothetical protein
LREATVLIVAFFVLFARARQDSVLGRAWRGALARAFAFTLALAGGAAALIIEPFVILSVKRGGLGCSWGAHPGFGLKEKKVDDCRRRTKSARPPSSASGRRSRTVWGLVGGRTILSAKHRRCGKWNACSLGFFMRYEATILISAQKNQKKNQKKKNIGLMSVYVCTRRVAPMLVATQEA